MKTITDLDYEVFEKALTDELGDLSDVERAMAHGWFDDVPLPNIFKALRSAILEIRDGRPAENQRLGRE